MVLPRTYVLARDIQYVDEGDSHHQLDLLGISNNRNRPMPVIVYIHGGAWCTGDKRDEEHLLVPLLEAGFLVANINHRFTPECKFPAQLHDAKAAVRWVRKNIADYGGEPSRIGVIGYSSGAHTATMLAATSGRGDMEGTLGDLTVSSDVQATVAVCAPSNFLAMEDQSNDGLQIATMYLGGEPASNEEVARLASPVFNIRRGCPPVFVVHGDNDYHVPVRQATELLQALKDNQVEHEQIMASPNGHIFWLGEPAIPDYISIPVVEFLRKHLEIAA